MSLRGWLAMAFVWFAVTGCGAAQAVSAFGRDEALTEANVNPVAYVNVNASPLLADALKREYGNYEGAVTWDGMMNELQNAQVVCIGEAHYDARDMETAFEIVRALASKKKIALAVERFSYDMQSALDKLNSLDSETAREAEMEAELQDQTYRTVWGNNSWDQTGFPVNTPSKPIFEAMVKWAAGAGIPIIALDVSLEQRQNGLGEDIPFRNQFWKQQIEKFGERHPRPEYQIVVIGGINHMTNAPDSFPSKMKITASAQVISIGQRDAMYGYLGAAKVAKLAADNHTDDLVIRHPQFALVNVKGVATLPNPPDYWIAVHAPQSDN